MQTNAREAYLTSLKEEYSVEIARTRDSIVQLSGNEAEKTTKLFLESKLGRLERRHKELGMEVSSAPTKEIKSAEPEVTTVETDFDAIRDAVYGLTGELVPFSMMPKYWKELSNYCAEIKSFEGEYATPRTLDKLKKLQRDLSDLVNDVKNEAAVNPYGYNAAFCGVSLEPGLAFKTPSPNRPKHNKKRRRGMSYDERRKAFAAGVEMSLEDKSARDLLMDAPGGLSIRPESNW